jgi:hypothetical protein
MLSAALPERVLGWTQAFLGGGVVGFRLDPGTLAQDLEERMDGARNVPVRMPEISPLTQV